MLGLRVLIVGSRVLLCYALTTTRLISAPNRGVDFFKGERTKNDPYERDNFIFLRKEQNQLPRAKEDTLENDVA